MSPTQEYVHIYTFEVGEGETALEMTARGSSEQEARAIIQHRLNANGMTRKIELQSVKAKVAVRTIFQAQEKAS